MPTVQRVEEKDKYFRVFDCLECARSGERAVTKEVFLKVWDIDEDNTKKDFKEAARQQVREGNSLDDIVRSLHKCLGGTQTAPLKVPRAY